MTRRPYSRPIFGIVAVAAAAAAWLPAPAQAEPNAQMKEVLDAYATISPIPIEKRSPPSPSSRPRSRRPSRS